MRIRVLGSGILGLFEIWETSVWGVAESGGSRIWGWGVLGNRDSEIWDLGSMVLDNLGGSEKPEVLGGFERVGSEEGVESKM